ncbi:16S rRNA (cytidine(1402)-2'-O)-methyltransferase [Modicisalibacter xianhensis]|uniref:Ribosomal RNA small subunit methyltransferase I n=1 Tax=Modicisalibacter xianhensis TaxID=442341 RepID=A0A1I3BZ64_9GAMM|nr:16S rRNA (cytidine(1402)-2'-O)-methyltransferase [Halomonas xianhensis]TDX30277.1 16S rRNA (cytidine1402-2'-O)-methyltransferase [Halomonas xianhensis]SFH67513.1 16S rRNA (cytidine1402-2'-O)-methyltransferase [Halomonas xianhensis]
MTESSKGTLYVVATPIGNLEDLSPRAAGVLAGVAVIAAEDTRHTARLLKHLSIERPLLSLHEHNEAGRVGQLSARLEGGEDVALVSDAGTPLISDPGFVLVRALRESGHRIVPVPGPCALVAALSAAGLPTDRFVFNGFLPAKRGARRNSLEALSERAETLVFYESPHRIRDSLEDIAAVLGERRVVLARELTKTFETFLDGSAEQLLERMAQDPDQARGEFVMMVAGAPPRDADAASLDGQVILQALLAEGIGVKQAAAVVSRLLGGRKKAWYELALSLKADG